MLSFSRMFLYLIGIALVVGALLMFFYYGGLNRWIPVSLLTAGILLVIGLAVMGFADSAPSERTERVHEHHDEPSDVIIHR